LPPHELTTTGEIESDITYSEYSDSDDDKEDNININNNSKNETKKIKQSMFSQEGINFEKLRLSNSTLQSHHKSLKRKNMDKGNGITNEVYNGNLPNFRE